jgi:uncharacterized protein (TIGR03435 family)
MKRVVLVLMFAMAVITAAAQRPKLEVASVKLNIAPSGPVKIAPQPGGRFTATNVSLKLLVGYAYRLFDFQISGGPRWLNSDHWDIVAKAEDDSVPQQTVQTGVGGLSRDELMVQSLLEERFNLKIHREVKELPVYDLLVSNGGIKVKLSDDQTPLTVRVRGTLLVEQDHLEAIARPLSGLAVGLSDLLGLIVIDKTNLSGLYDFKMQWMPDVNQSTGIFGAVNVPRENPNAPSIFTALQEHLGLKLESARGPVEVLVVDSVSKPS